MPPRARLSRNTSPMAAEDLEFSEWERSKISNQDVNLLKKLGLAKKDKTLIFPSEESFPTPRIGYRLHQLTPNSIIHIYIFITLCECFLGTPPNWGPWKRIFLVRRNSSHNIAYNVGGVVVCVRSYVEYFDVKFPDSVQGWRKRWLYIREEHIDSQDYNIAPFHGSEKILRRRSWDAEATGEEKAAKDALRKRIHELQNTRGKELSGIQITAHFLRIRVQPLQARKNPLWMYAGDKDADCISKDLSVKDLEKLIRRISLLSKKDTIPSSCRVEPYSGANPLPKPLMKEFIRLGTQFVGYRDTVESLKEALAKANNRADDLAIKLEQSEKAREKAEQDAASVGDLRKRLDQAETALSENITQQNAREEDFIGRLESQNRRFVRKMVQDFELERPEGDRLLDTLSLLEIHGDLAHRSITDARTAFTRLFPYFFPKKSAPETFSELAKCYIPEEDLGLAFRQENLKIQRLHEIIRKIQTQWACRRGKLGCI
ncbi:hypothetical protein QYE76_049914 [Lolium multiflorum]|uniref:Transposase (putative) gypsy type domain-containing protein n=1 Tax=Lolium multiflorum TaxID=4521 RepID=A0AAD8SQ31_LOLMU|nr:hypothetical protein QYE76_049914 [Lolium multiflorum]